MGDSHVFGGVEIDEDTIHQLLTRKGHGVLSLASGGDAYGVPISFGYLDGRIYFVLIKDNGMSKKMNMLSDTESASLLVEEITTADEWWSVIVQGSPRLVSEGKEWERLAEAVHANAWRPQFDLSDGIGGVEGYVSYPRLKPWVCRWTPSPSRHTRRWA